MGSSHQDYWGSVGQTLEQKRASTALKVSLEKVSMATCFRRTSKERHQRYTLKVVGKKIKKRRCFICLKLRAVSCFRGRHRRSRGGRQADYVGARCRSCENALKRKRKLELKLRLRSG